MPKITDITSYFIYCSQKQNHFLNVNKLQFFLYYSQMYHLAYNQSLLFNEPIITQQNGVIIEPVFYDYLQYRYKSIDIQKNYPTLNPKTEKILSLVNNIYTHFDSFELEKYIKSELPFIEAYATNNPIDVKKYKSYYRTNALTSPEKEQLKQTILKHHEHALSSYNKNPQELLPLFNLLDFIEQLPLNILVPQYHHADHWHKPHLHFNVHHDILDIYFTLDRIYYKGLISFKQINNSHKWKKSIPKKLLNLLTHYPFSQD